MTRLLSAKTGAHLLALAQGATAGLTEDLTETYNGHSTLRYDGNVAGAGVLLGGDLTGGFSRLWARVVFRPSTSLWDSGEPAPGTAPVPLAFRAANATWTATAGLWEAYDDAGSNRYRGWGQLARAGETLAATHRWNGTTGDTIGKPTVQGLGYQTYDILIERIGYASCQLVRQRVWRRDVDDLDDPTATLLLLDRFFTPAATPVDYWLTWGLAIDTGVYGANTQLWLAELELFDAERDPDPFDLAFLFCDGFDHTSFGVSPVYECKSQITHRNNGGAKTGPCFLYARGFGSSFSALRFCSKDLKKPDGIFTWAEPSIAVGMHFAPVVASNPVEFLTFHFGESSTSTEVHLPPPGVMCRFVLTTDGHLQLQDASGTVVVTSPFTLTLAAWPGYVWRHLSFLVGFGETNGWLLVFLDGELVWSAFNIHTADDDGAAAACSSITWGQSQTSYSSGSSFPFEYAIDDTIVSRGVEYRMGKVRWLPPHADGERTAGWSQFNGWNTGTWAVSIDGGSPMWWALWTDLVGEPDDDFSSLWMDLPFTLAKRITVQPCRLPDLVCGGTIAGVVPVADLRRRPAQDPTAAQTFEYCVRVGGTAYLSPQLGGLRSTDPPGVGGFFAQYAGANGFQSMIRWAWGRHPVTGESWDAAAVPEIGVNGVDASLEVTMLGAYVLQVRPSNLGPPPGEPALAVYRNGEYREVEALQVFHNGQWREVLALWEYRSGEWRTVPLDGVTWFPYCPLGPAAAVIIEDFFGGKLTPWLMSPAPDGGGDISFASGAMVISLTTSSGGFGDTLGMEGNPNVNLVDRTIEVEVSAVPPTSTGKWFVLEVGAVGFGTVAMWVRDDQLFFGVPGTPDTEYTSAFYNATNHRWWRLRHDAAAGDLVAEVSADGVTWSEFGREVGGWTTTLVSNSFWFLYLRRTDAAGTCTATVDTLRVGPLAPF